MSPKTAQLILDTVTAFQYGLWTIGTNFTTLLHNPTQAKLRKNLLGQSLLRRLADVF